MMEFPARFITRTKTHHPIEIYRSAFAFSYCRRSKAEEFLEIIYGVVKNENIEERVC